MDESKKFYDIVMKPEYGNEYKEAWLMVKHHPYIVKIPITPIKLFDAFRKLAYDKILYRLKEKTSPEKTSPMKKRGRPLKYHYKDKQEASHFYYEAFKAKIARLAKACA